MKAILITTVFALTVIFACNKDEIKDEPVTNNTTDKTAQNIKIAEKVFELFNLHEWDSMAALYIDPAEFKDPSFGKKPVMRTRKQIAATYRSLGNAFPDIHDSVIAIYPSGQANVIVEFISSGSSGSTKWTMPICTIFTIENGSITKDYTYYDN